jgi:predicted acetyltransferase
VDSSPIDGARTSVLRLRPYKLDDEQSARRGHEEMKKDNFTFLLGWDDDSEWPIWLHEISQHRRGLSLSPGIVPAAQLCADVNGQIVGRISVRFQLNKELALFGGHIGFGVLPDHRQRGYATEILRQGLVIARGEGLTRVLIICNDDNLGSARTIEMCGGELEGVATAEDGATKIRRYWIK